MNSNTLSFHPPSSYLNPSFWEYYYDLKLKKYQLNQSFVPITGYLSNEFGFLSPSLMLDNRSLDNITDKSISINGFIQSMNTVEEFKLCNKQQLIELISQSIWENIKSGEAIKKPHLLISFSMIIYADLKSYKFNYWVNIPALVPSNPFTYNSISQLKHVLDNINIIDLYTKLSNKLINTLNLYQIFVYNKKDNEIKSLEEGWIDRYNSDCYIIILDSTQTISESCSWYMRNLLILLSYHQIDRSMTNLNSSYNPNTTRIISLRGKTVSFLLKHMIDKSVYQPTLEEIIGHDESIIYEINLGDPYQFTNDLPRVVGWEPNERGKSGPRLADLSNTLDTSLQMRQAVDLNIRLMKWRMWPDLDSDAIAATKCLLLGSGTLGCAVARALVGWGVRNITLLDNGNVSFSNPTRQCLFEYQHAVDRTPKSLAAAEALRRIFPDVNSNGIVGTIPMPGHPIAFDNIDSDEWKNDIDLLDKLVKENDVIFALTDSREARWLPTVLASRYDKLLINAALGFDSYLVMRHGHGVSIDQDNIPKIDKSFPRLGCYFCTDIVAAANSQKDRTLDQQCTVTRPGLSFIAAALSVELMVSVIHNKNKLNSKIDCDNDDIDEEVVIPHQIRGSLLGFTQMNLMTPAFEQCTACSLPIISSYLQSSHNFVKNVCNNPTLLEEISGITSLLSNVDLDNCVDSDDDF